MAALVEAAIAPVAEREVVVVRGLVAAADAADGQQGLLQVLARGPDEGAAQHDSWSRHRRHRRRRRCELCWRRRRDERREAAASSEVWPLPPGAGAGLAA